MLHLALLALTASAQDKPEEPADPAGETPATEEPAPAPAPSGPPAATAEELEALKKTVEELAATVESQKETIDEQSAAIEAQQGELAKTKLKLIPPDTWTFEIRGYYRSRGYIFPNLFKPSDQGRDARFMDHHLRIQPTFNYRDLAKFSFQVNGLKDVVWGDNAQIANTPVFAADPSFNDREGRTVPDMQLTRAWTEFRLPVGVVRFGRMPSHWGIGLLANDGDWHDGDKRSPLPNTSRNNFGEAGVGATFDRALFATRPVAIAQTIMGKEDSGVPLITAIAVDRLVEDPLFEYKGYQCEAGIYDDQDGYQRRCDFNNDGLTDLDHSYVIEDRTEEQRGLDWWADQNDDVYEVVYVLVYRGEDIRYLGAPGDLTAGAYFIQRVQPETDSDVLISDAYIYGLWRGINVEFEFVSISGESAAIALPGTINPDGNPLRKDVNIAGYVGRLGYVQPGWKVMFETGFASGDNNVADVNFTGRPLTADHNVGLLLYEEVISRITAAGWTEEGRALWSGGGVYNSRYIAPTAHVYPLDNWEILGGFVMAWPHKADGAFIKCNNDDADGCQLPDNDQATASNLGWEADLGIHHNFHKHALLALEAGYAETTDRLNVEAAGLNPNGKFFTFQSRIAWKF